MYGIGGPVSSRAAFAFRKMITGKGILLLINRVQLALDLGHHGLDARIRYDSSSLTQSSGQAASASPGATTHTAPSRLKGSSTSAQRRRSAGVA